jgi:hypothetical protein
MLANASDADPVVLAIEASQPAVGEKYRTGTIPSDEGRFLAEVGEGARDLDLVARPTKPRLAPGSVHSAVPWAQRAFAVHFGQLERPAGQLSSGMKLQI